jgi:hypothetical protein
MEKFISLYDYLGNKAAGAELGKQVAKAAKAMKIPTETRYVKNEKYEGNVVLYPEYWLSGYMAAQAVEVEPQLELKL